MDEKSKKPFTRSNIRSILAGIGSLLCIYPAQSRSTRLSDTQLLQDDWKVIDKDYRETLSTITHELQSSN